MPLFYHKLIELFTSPFIKLWRGQYSLPVAFWWFLVLGVSIFRVFVAMLLAFPFLVLEQRAVGFLIGFIIMVGYPFIAAVGVWRSADNSKTIPFYKSATKFFACFIFIVVVAQALGINNFKRLMSMFHQ